MSLENSSKIKCDQKESRLPLSDEMVNVRYHVCDKSFYLISIQCVQRSTSTHTIFRSRRVSLNLWSYVTFWRPCITSDLLIYSLDQVETLTLRLRNRFADALRKIIPRGRAILRKYLKNHINLKVFIIGGNINKMIQKSPRLEKYMSGFGRFFLFLF